MKWDENRKNKIRKQILSKISPFMREVVIFRDGKNAFKESKSKPDYVGKFLGYKHTDNSNLYAQAAQNTTINKTYSDRFLIIVDDDSLKIQEGDYFYIDNVKHTIIDKGNLMDIVFDMFIDKAGATHA